MVSLEFVRVLVGTSGRRGVAVVLRFCVCEGDTRRGETEGGKTTEGFAVVLVAAAGPEVPYVPDWEQGLSQLTPDYVLDRLCKNSSS